MRNVAWMLAGLTALGTSSAIAADSQGQTSGADQVQWARWQGRLSLGSSVAPWRLGVESAATRFNSASLMGDYYFSRSLTNGTRLGGFRATSGLIIGPKGTLGALGTGQPSGAAGGAFTIGSRSYGASALPYGIDATTDTATVPYLGVGYTNLSVRSRWGFSADLGLVGQSSNNGARLGRALTGGQSLDDVIRDMRLAPMFQLGVSYSF